MHWLAGHLVLFFLSQSAHCAALEPRSTMQCREQHHAAMSSLPAPCSATAWALTRCRRPTRSWTPRPSSSAPVRLRAAARPWLRSGCHLGKPLLPSSSRSAPTATHPLPAGDVISLPCAGDATSGESPFDLLSRRSDLSILFKAALAAGDEFIKTLNGQWVVGWWVGHAGSGPGRLVGGVRPVGWSTVSMALALLSLMRLSHASLCHLPSPPLL